MITATDLQSIAHNLATRHGIVALQYADKAIAEMEARGDSYRTECWVALRDVLEDVLVLTESGADDGLVAPTIH